MIRRMPIAGSIHPQTLALEKRDVSVQGRYHFIASRDGKRTTWKKIILHVHDHKRVASTKLNACLHLISKTI